MKKNFKQNDRCAFLDSIFKDLSRKIVFEEEQTYSEEWSHITTPGGRVRQRAR